MYENTLNLNLYFINLWHKTPTKIPIFIENNILCVFPKKEEFKTPFVVL